MQDPFTMLNPLERCGTQITAALRTARGATLPKRERRREALARLAEVGIHDPRVADQFPFELSGGMRQRVAIAAAIAENPRVLIADEPTTALDVTTQKDVLDLLNRSRITHHLGLVLITHDLRVAPQVGLQHIADPRLWTVVPVDVIDGARSYLNIKYATTLGWRPLTLDLHVPIESAGPVPAVVYAHGGSMVGGAKEMGPWASLPAHGIAVASVDYRLAGEVRYPEAIEDVLAAIRWVRAHADEYGLDGDRIAGWGSSAGGYLVARAAFADENAVGRRVGRDTETSSRLSAVVLHYPPTDFSTVLDDAYEPTDAGQALTSEVISRSSAFSSPNVPTRSPARRFSKRFRNTATDRQFTSPTATPITVSGWRRAGDFTTLS